MATTNLGRKGWTVGAAAAALLAVFVWIGGSTAGAAGPTCTTNAQNAKLCLTLTDKPDPVSYSTFDGNQTYLSYHAVLANQSVSSSMSHVALKEVLPAGTTFVRSTSSRGSCSSSAGTVTCTIGSLKKGESGTVDVVVTAPATSDPNPAPQVLTNAATGSFDENFNDNPNNGGKQDTVSVSENTTVSKPAGQTYVPQGGSGQVDTDPDQPQYANVKITNASVDVLATIKLLPPDNFCLLGQVTIQGQVHVCRNGGWVSASVTNANTGAKYVNSANPLVFHLSWDQSLTSALQTESNFVVFYRTTAGSSIQVIQARCNANATNLPCLRNIVHGADGSWSVDLVKADNGHMR